VKTSVVYYTNSFVNNITIICDMEVGTGVSETAAASVFRVADCSSGTSVLFYKLHGCTSKKTVILIFKVGRKPDLICGHCSYNFCVHMNINSSNYYVNTKRFLALRSMLTAAISCGIEWSICLHQNYV
jgi:hypothetical protein